MNFMDHHWGNVTSARGHQKEPVQFTLIVKCNGKDASFIGITFAAPFLIRPRQLETTTVLLLYKLFLILVFKLPYPTLGQQCIFSRRREMGLKNPVSAKPEQSIYIFILCVQ